MFGSEILDVAIGLMLVYLLISLICSAVREVVEGWLKTRAVFLERGIRELLKDPDGKGLVKDLYSHPLVYGLFRGDYDPKRIRGKLGATNLPAYIPARNFAVALLDIAVRGAASSQPADPNAEMSKISLDSIRTSVTKLENTHVQRVLLSAVDLANNQLAQAQTNVEAWFNSAMDRVSGWYKRRTQVWIFLLGVLVAAAANVNTFNIARYLYRDDGARSALIAGAAAVTRDTSVQSEGLDQLLTRVEQLELPIGWTYGLSGQRPSDSSKREGTLPLWLIAALGWIVTGLAVSLGAPFWFDLLNKFMVIRSTVKPHEKSPEEESEDRQKPRPRDRRTGDSGGSTSSSTAGENTATLDHRQLENQLPDQPDVGP